MDTALSAGGIFVLFTVACYWVARYFGPKFLEGDCALPASKSLWGLALVFALPPAVCIVGGGDPGSAIVLGVLGVLAILDYLTTYMPRFLVHGFIVVCMAVAILYREALLGQILLLGTFLSVALITKSYFARRGVIPMAAGDVYILAGLCLVIPASLEAVIGFLFHVGFYGLIFHYLKPPFLCSNGTEEENSAKSATPGSAAGVPLVPTILLTAIHGMLAPEWYITSLFIRSIS